MSFYGLEGDLSTGKQVLPAHGAMQAPVDLFVSPRLPLSSAEIDGLIRVASLEDVVQVVGLPDLHIKPQLETPSSTTTGTRNSIILSLSSPSPGCGMALALTPLGVADLDPSRLDAFFNFLVRRLPFQFENQAVLEEIFLMLLARGAAAAVEHFGLDAHLLRAVEDGGNAASRASPCLIGSALEPGSLSEVIPTGLLPLAGREFGTLGRGNHFLELQVVEDVLDAQTAARWGVEVGQVAVMYHADSGRLGALVGRLYAHRRKNHWRGRWIELCHKVAFHWSQARSANDFYNRLGSYFLPYRYCPLPDSSDEAAWALRAHVAAINYAFANRIAIFAALQNALRSIWGETAGRPTLLYDVTHNSIRREQAGSEMLWVHRHNASRALPGGHPDLAESRYAETGSPVLLPGTNRTSSYLCVARAGVAGSLFSVDHGAGRSAQRLASDSPDSARFTRHYGSCGGLVTTLRHQTDDGIEEILSVLAQAELASPVARLRPLAVLKSVAK